MNLFKETENVLVIPDLHAPFIHPKFLQHCKDTYKKFKCNRVVFLGDLIDSHYSSRFETDPDGHSAGKELELAIEEIQKWYKAFPVASVCIGNHCTIIQRQAYSNGISSRWIKDFGDVLNTPGWVFKQEFIFNNVLYTHGQGSSNLLGTILHSRMNVVIGHYHSQFKIEYTASQKDMLWGIISGCGIDNSAYAFSYGKHFLKKPIIGCSVVLNNGTLPILVPLSL